MKKVKASHFFKFLNDSKDHIIESFAKENASSLKWIKTKRDKQIINEIIRNKSDSSGSSSLSLHSNTSFDENKFNLKDSKEKTLVFALNGDVKGGHENVDEIRIEYRSAEPHDFITAQVKSEQVVHLKDPLQEMKAMICDGVVVVNYISIFIVLYSFANFFRDESSLSYNENWMLFTHSMILMVVVAFLCETLHHFCANDLEFYQRSLLFLTVIELTFILRAVFFVLPGRDAGMGMCITFILSMVRFAVQMLVLYGVSKLKQKLYRLKKK